MQGKLEELEKELVETNSNMERLQRSHSELKEMQLVLDTAGNFFDSKATAKLAAGGEYGGFSEGEAPLLESQVRKPNFELCPCLIFIYVVHAEHRA